MMTPANVPPSYTEPPYTDAADAFEDLAGEIRAGILKVTSWTLEEPARLDAPARLSVGLVYTTAPERT